MGLVHASANVVALSLYVRSSVARKRGRRLRGWWLSASGFGTITMSNRIGQAACPRTQASDGGA